MSQQTRTMRVLLFAAAVAGGLTSVAVYAPAQAQTATAATTARQVTPQMLPRAIAAAERFGNGGKVMEARFRNRKGVAGFDAVIADKGGRFTRVRVDSPANNVLALSDTEVPGWMADWVLKADAKSLQQAKLSLGDAVTKAEQVTGSPAVGAAVAAPLTGGNQVLAYNVAVLRANRPERVAIDAMSGEQISDPDALLEMWSPEKAFSEAAK